MISDKEAPFARTFRLFLYQHIKYGWFTVFESSDGEPSVYEDYVRISDGIDVQFQKISTEDGVQEALKSLDKAEHAAREALNKTLMELADKRAQLMSLTYQPSAPAVEPVNDLPF